MDIQEILQLYFDRSNAFQTLWNLYIAVSIGLLAFVATAAKACHPRQIRAVISVAFLAFAASNLNSLNLVRIQRSSLAKVADAAVLTEESGQLRELIHAGRPPSVAGLFLFHLALDAGVVGLIWVIPRYAGRDPH